MPDTLVEIVPAEVGDAGKILELQRIAFQIEAELYGRDDLPPLTQTLEELEAAFAEQVFLKAMEGARIVGSVRARQQDGACAIGRLMVHPDYQRRGIGARLVEAIERAFPEADRYEIFTGDKSVGNIRLYERLGYRIFRRRPLDESITMVCLEKTLRQDSSPLEVGHLYS